MNNKKKIKTINNLKWTRINKLQKTLTWFLDKLNETENNLKQTQENIEELQMTMELFHDYFEELIEDITEEEAFQEEEEKKFNEWYKKTIEDKENHSE